MERRKFFFGLGALSALQVASPLKAANPGIFAPEKKRVPMKVRDLQVLELLGKNKYRAYYVKVITEDGIEGLYGPIDNEAVMMINGVFKKQLIFSKRYIFLFH